MCIWGQHQGAVASSTRALLALEPKNSFKRTQNYQIKGNCNLVSGIFTSFSDRKSLVFVGSACEKIG